jgi:hypothetical protein
MGAYHMKGDFLFPLHRTRQFLKRARKLGTFQQKGEERRSE